MKLNNKYYLLRHGEARSNVEDIVSSWPEKFENSLTQAGADKIKRVAAELKNKKIDLIFTSPLLRTKETADIVAKVVGAEPMTEERLRELDFGVYNGKSAGEFIKYFGDKSERLTEKTPEGENYQEVLDRTWDFFEELESKYKGKNILIVSHQAPILLLLGKLIGESVPESMDGLINIKGERKVTKGQLIELN